MELSWACNVANATDEQLAGIRYMKEHCCFEPETCSRCPAEPPQWVCPCQRALWREYNDPAHVPLTIGTALLLSSSAFAFRKDQRDTFVDVVSLAAKVRPHRMAITAVSDVEASASFDGVYVNFTITVPGADEKLVAPMLAVLTNAEKMRADLAEKRLPTLIAVVKACVVDACGMPAYMQHVTYFV